MSRIVVLKTSCYDIEYFLACHTNATIPESFASSLVFCLFKLKLPSQGTPREDVEARVNHAKKREEVRR